MEEKQKRWQSPVLWASFFALVYFAAKEWIGFEIPGWDTFVSILTAGLVALGIINNPQNPNAI